MATTAATCPLARTRRARCTVQDERRLFRRPATTATRSTCMADLSRGAAARRTASCGRGCTRPGARAAPGHADGATPAQRRADDAPRCGPAALLIAVAAPAGAETTVTTTLSMASRIHRAHRQRPDGPRGPPGIWRHQLFQFSRCNCITNCTTRRLNEWHDLHNLPLMTRIVTTTYRYKPPPKRKGRKLAEITGPAIVTAKEAAARSWRRRGGGGRG